MEDKEGVSQARRKRTKSESEKYYIEDGMCEMLATNLNVPMFIWFVSRGETSTLL